MIAKPNLSQKYILETAIRFIYHTQILDTLMAKNAFRIIKKKLIISLKMLKQLSNRTINRPFQKIFFWKNNSIIYQKEDFFTKTEIFLFYFEDQFIDKRAVFSRSTLKELLRSLQ